MMDGNEETRNRPLLYRLTFRTVLFLFLMLCALMLFYVIGNYQQFLDSSLLRILFLAACTAVLLVFFSAAGFIESVLFLIFGDDAGHRLSYILRAVLMALLAALGTVIVIVTRSADFLSHKF